MLGLMILPMLLGAAFLFDDDGSGSEDPIGQPDSEEPVQTDPEENGDLIQFDRDDTRYSGSDAAVEVRGNNLDNIIRAGGGDDTVVAEGGDDRVFGDAGDDTLYGRDGDDVVFGGTGDDRIFLGMGDDASGSSGENGPSDMFGDDFVRGGAGDDQIFDNFGSNHLMGDVGNDTLVAVDGNNAVDQSISEADFGTTDTLDGGTGNDLLRGDDGDILIGGTGDDDFGVIANLSRDQAVVEIKDFAVTDDVLSVFSNAATSDEEISFAFDAARGGVIASVASEEVAILEGLVADDIANITSTFFHYDEAGLTEGYSEVEGGVVNMLAAQTPYTGTIAGVEVQANALNNTLNAGGGNDTVVGLDGDDLISGDAGDDVLYGNNGVDSVAGGDGDDQIFLGEGDDVSGSSELADASQMLGDDVIRGGAGFDEIVDHVGANQLFGDQGADVLDATDGIVAADPTASIADFGTAYTLNGGAGADTLIGDDGDTMIGGTGTDNFTAIRDFTRVQAAVQVVDFDVSEDVLTVSQNTPTDVIVFTFDAAQNGVVATVAGQAVAVLQGLDAADIPNIWAAFVPDA